MATVTFKGNPVQISGDLPAAGNNAPAFSLTKTDLSDVNANDFQGKRVVLNIFPSVDTPVCAASVRRFNQEAAGLAKTVVLCISADLPFALARFCGAEGLDDVIPLSDFRNKEFGPDFGIRIAQGPLAGLLARSIVVLDKDGRITYTELVPEIAQEPDYDAALEAIKKS